MKMPTIAGASPFAHLRGTTASLSTVDAKKAEDDEKKKKDDEAKKAEDDEKKKKDDEAKKAEDDEKKKKDDEAKKAEDDEKKKKDDEAKKSKKADGDDNSDGEDDNDPDARAARARERGRVRAIMISDAGKANPAGAMHLATGTSMPRGQAIEMLAAMGTAMPPTAREDIRHRMAAVPQPDIGNGGEQPAPNDPKAFAQAILAANKKALGEIA